SVRQDTNGLAQIVDYYGAVLASSDYFSSDPQTIVEYVPTRGVRTIYATVGDVFAWLCVAALLSCRCGCRRKTPPTCYALSRPPRSARPKPSGPGSPGGRMRQTGWVSRMSRSRRGGLPAVVARLARRGGTRCRRRCGRRRRPRAGGSRPWAAS